MLRLLHSFLFISHTAFIYVDDLMIWLEEVSSPLWASLVIVLTSVLGIPISWSKARLSNRVEWIGWRFDLSCWSISLPLAKKEKLQDQITELLQGRKVALSQLQSVVGRLLWVTSYWKMLRPLLSPLYKCMFQPPLTLVGLSHSEWALLLSHIDEDLQITTSWGHPSLYPGVSLHRVGNSTVTRRSQLFNLPLKNRRIWVGIRDSHSAHRIFTEEAKTSLATWLKLLHGTSFSRTLLPYSRVAGDAKADAMATSELVGVGGYVKLPDGSCVWFQKRFDLHELRLCFPWVTAPLQKHITAWETLAQYLLSWSYQQILPKVRGPSLLVQASDNIGTEASTSKGLSSHAGLCHILSCYFSYLELHALQVDIQHVPGRNNELADALSRFKPHHLPATSQVFPDLSALVQLSARAPQDAHWPAHFSTMSRCWLDE